MDEYISREETIKRIKECYCTGCNSYNGVRCRACGTGDAIDMIEDTTAADVAPVRHGQWIEYTKVIIPEPYNKWEQAWKCSECGFDDGFVAYNYCPNCGAKMDIKDGGDSDAAD